MNKKGFTLVELLAAIGILSLLMGIAAIAYSSILERGKERAFSAYESTMKAQAMEILVESVTDPTKTSLIPANHESIRLYLSDLEIDPFVNPVNKNDICPNSFVEVKRRDVDSSGAHVDAFEYKVCLICPETDYATSEDCISPTYYSYGPPTTSSTTNYEDISENILLALKDDKISLCIKHRGIKCFDSSSSDVVYDLQKAFDNSDCDMLSDVEMICDNSKFRCYRYHDGGINCYSKVDPYSNCVDYPNDFHQCF